MFHRVPNIVVSIHLHIDYCLMGVCRRQEMRGLSVHFSQSSFGHISIINAKITKANLSTFVCRLFREVFTPLIRTLSRPTLSS